MPLMLNDKLGLVCTHVFHRDVLVAAHPARVEHVTLVGVLLASDLTFLGINHDDKITGVSMRRVLACDVHVKHWRS